MQSFTKLAGSTVTVVGLGSLGEAVVRRLARFDVETLGVQNSPAKGGPVDERTRIARSVRSPRCLREDAP
ncbi:NAD(P)-dependent oxidoreductase [Halogranum amylolyticum]|uniref:NAD(P)-dependent oxidoreductase n=1 Tax=Halogranum amylolyticum TaxID=660520 RepID=UPI00373FD228